MTVLALGTALAFTSTAKAQEKKEEKKGSAAQPKTRPGGPATIQERMKRMGEELKLTEEQKEQLKPVFQEELKKMNELRENTKFSREQKQEKLQEFQTGLAAKIKPILTGEQNEMWTKMSEEARKRKAKQ